MAEGVCGLVAGNQAVARGLIRHSGVLYWGLKAALALVAWRSIPRLFRVG